MSLAPPLFFVATRVREYEWAKILATAYFSHFSEEVYVPARVRARLSDLPSRRRVIRVAHYADASEETAGDGDGIVARAANGHFPFRHAVRRRAEAHWQNRLVAEVDGDTMRRFRTGDIRGNALGVLVAIRNYLDSRAAEIDFQFASRADLAVLLKRLQILPADLGDALDDDETREQAIGRLLGDIAADNHAVHALLKLLIICAEDRRQDKHSLFLYEKIDSALQSLGDGSDRWRRIESLHTVLFSEALAEIGEKALAHERIAALLPAALEIPAADENPADALLSALILRIALDIDIAEKQQCYEALSRRIGGLPKVDAKAIQAESFIMVSRIKRHMHDVLEQGETTT